MLNLTTEKHCPSHFLLLLFRVPRPSGDEESNLPYYRRFSRGMGLLSSSEENLPSAKLDQSQFPPSPNFRPQKEYIQIRDHHKNPNVPHYRRFARSSSLSTPSPASSSSSEESARPASRLPPLFRYPEPDTGSIIVWPASGRMNAFLGKAKIEEFIKKVRFSGGFQRGWRRDDGFWRLEIRLKQNYHRSSMHQINAYLLLWSEPKHHGRGPR